MRSNQKHGRVQRRQICWFERIVVVVQATTTLQLYLLLLLLGVVCPWMRQPTLSCTRWTTIGSQQNVPRDRDSLFAGSKRLHSHDSTFAARTRAGRDPFEPSQLGRRTSNRFWMSISSCSKDINNNTNSSIFVHRIEKCSREQPVEEENRDGIQSMDGAIQNTNITNSDNKGFYYYDSGTREGVDTLARPTIQSMTTMSSLGDIMSSDTSVVSSTVGPVFGRDSTNATTSPTMATSAPKNETNGAPSSSSAAAPTTTASSSNGYLALQYDIQHPLDRLALTANGNLQRLVASYYDAPVTVVVESCVLRKNANTNNNSSTTANAPPFTWDRTVHLQVHNQTFCTARSVIFVHDAQCQSLVATGAVGLGQLFRYLDILPHFVLHNAGKSDPTPSSTSVSIADESNKSQNFANSPDSSYFSGPGGGGFWRYYTLQCNAVTCRIHETFVPGMWSLSPGCASPSSTSAADLENT